MACSSLQASIQQIRHPKSRASLGFRQELFEGFFRTPGIAAKRHSPSAARWPVLPPAAVLVRQPVSGLPAAVWTVAARAFRLWLLDGPDVGPRHACVAPFVCRVILAISHDIFGPVRIVLQKRHGADADGTGRAGHDPHPTLVIGAQAPPKSI